MARIIFMSNTPEKSGTVYVDDDQGNTMWEIGKRWLGTSAHKVGDGRIQVCTVETTQAVLRNQLFGAGFTISENQEPAAGKNDPPQDRI